MYSLGRWSPFPCQCIFYNVLCDSSYYTYKMNDTQLRCVCVCLCENSVSFVLNMCPYFSASEIHKMRSTTAENETSWETSIENISQTWTYFEYDITNNRLFSFSCCCWCCFCCYLYLLFHSSPISLSLLLHIDFI